MKPPFFQKGTHDGNSLAIRSGLLVAVYKFESLPHSIVGFLRAFKRQLYFGHMHRDVFLYGWYLAAKEHAVKELLTHTDFSQEQRDRLGFLMYMARTGQKQKWKYPALMNRDPNGRLQQMTGNNRALASLLVHDRPWQHYPILLAEHPDFDAGAVLENPLLVDTDQKLHEVLGVDPESEEWSPKMELTLQIEQSDDELWCKLDYVGNGYYHDHNPRSAQDLLAQYDSWRRKYARPIPLAVYTQWPDMLIDRAGIFDIEIVGSSEGMLLDERPGTAERPVRAYHNNPVHRQDHVLWVIGPRTIDLADLLFWMDTTHSTYISTDWQFILWRRQIEYVNQFISMSQASG